jgi:hypothetical protein
LSVADDTTVRPELEPGPDAPATTARRAEGMAARRSVRTARARARRQRLVRRTILPSLAITTLIVVALAVVVGPAPSPRAGTRVASGGTVGTTASSVSSSTPTSSSTAASSSVSPAPVTRGRTVGLPGPGAPLPPPTIAAPLPVLVIGDALAGDVGGALTTELAPSRLAAVTVDARPGTGLTRPDLFDWLGVLPAELGRLHPALVVVVLGSADHQAMTGSGAIGPPGSTAWLARYDARARRLAAEVTASGARLLWVGMPAMGSPSASIDMQLLDGVYQDAAGATDGAVYLASWPVLSTAAGAYAATLRGPSGATTRVRAGDGVGITPAGALLVSRTMVSAIDTEWRLSLRP